MHVQNAFTCKQYTASTDPGHPETMSEGVVRKDAAELGAHRAHCCVLHMRVFQRSLRQIRQPDMLSMHMHMSGSPQHAISDCIGMHTCLLRKVDLAIKPYCYPLLGALCPSNIDGPRGVRLRQPHTFDTAITPLDDFAQYYNRSLKETAIEDPRNGSLKLQAKVASTPAAGRHACAYAC